MWKKLKDTYYFLNFTEQLEVYFTNYISVWGACFTDASFLGCLKDSNLGLEMDDKELLEVGKSMLFVPEELKSIAIDKGADDNLDVIMRIFCGFPLKLVMKLPKMSDECFFSLVTQPLLRIVQDLKNSERELRQELLKKDKEIEEYKCEGGEIALRYLKTVPFNDEEHLEKHTAFRSHFDSCEVPQILLSKAVDIPEKKDIVKHEPSESNSKESGKIKKYNLSLHSSSKKSEPNLTLEKSPKIKLEPNATQDTSETEAVKTKTDILAEIGSIKTEPRSDSQNCSGRPMVSPPKRKKTKLNF